MRRATGFVHSGHDGTEFVDEIAGAATGTMVGTIGAAGAIGGVAVPFLPEARAP